ncbi:hypothetical protein PHSC3_001190 [Chlamydiales bacterium STE3]|nr:hypothetical protein PHSC3_001190 [Chlamydiales bacterium STE3]
MNFYRKNHRLKKLFEVKIIYYTQARAGGACSLSSGCKLAFLGRAFIDIEMK